MITGCGRVSCIQNLTPSGLPVDVAPVSPQGLHGGWVCSQAFRLVALNKKPDSSIKGLTAFIPPVVLTFSETYTNVW